MSSILTNHSAKTALQTLKNINSELNKVQNEISTGRKISDGSDNAGIWAIAKVMEADVSSFKTIRNSLAMGQSTVAVAAAAAEQIVNVLDDMKALAITASSENADFAKIEAGLASGQAQIESIRDAAQFNGANLLVDDVDGNGATSLTVMSSLDRQGSGAPTVATIAIDTLDLNNNMDLSGRTTVADVTSAATALTEIEAFLQTAIDGAATLGASSARMGGQMEFVDKMTDAMKMGIGSLIDADMEESSARLQALQVQQQLAIQAMSIANSNPQTILQLFR